MKPQRFLVVVILLGVHCGLSVSELSDISCTGGQFYVGQSAVITCHFGKDVNATKKDFNVAQYPSYSFSDKSNTALACNWRDTNLVCGIIHHGFVFRHSVNEQLVLEIPNVTRSIAGTYLCDIVGDDGGVHRPATPCNVTVTDPPPTTVLSSSTVAHDTDAKSLPQDQFEIDSVHIVLLVILAICVFILVPLAVGCVFIRYKYRLVDKRGTRTNAGDAESQDGWKSIPCCKAPTCLQKKNSASDPTASPEEQVPLSPIQEPKEGEKESGRPDTQNVRLQEDSKEAGTQNFRPKEESGRDQTQNIRLKAEPGKTDSQKKESGKEDSQKEPPPATTKSNQAEQGAIGLEPYPVAVSTDEDGVQYGNQPHNGTMGMQYFEDDIPGYKGHGYYEIRYKIPSGTQMEHLRHPHPGDFYHSTDRTAYLPDTEEGRKVLMLLKTAFDRRLIFTIGKSKSRTTTDDEITWSSIPHKTSRMGGPKEYCYPDDEYLPKVQMELKNKGVTEQDLNRTQKDFIQHPQKYYEKPKKDFSDRFDAVFS